MKKRATLPSAKVHRACLESASCVVPQLWLGSGSSLPACLGPEGSALLVALDVRHQLLVCNVSAS